MARPAFQATLEQHQLVSGSSLWFITVADLPFYSQ